MLLRSQRPYLPWFAGALLCGVLGSVGSKAHALQPLELFLEGARRANFDNRESQATTDQRVVEIDVAQGRLYPAFSASGTYTRNQYEVALTLPTDGSLGAGAGGERLVIQPQNQIDGTLTLSVPVIDFAGWKRVAAAKASADAARVSQQASAQDVDVTVFRAYYQLLGQEAVLESAKRSLELLRKNLEVVQVRVEGGTASELDVQRSKAEIARAEGDVAAADVAVVTARRTLATASTIEPEPATSFLDDDLHEEAPLDNWLAYSGRTARVQAVYAAEHAAIKNASAAKAAWLPTLSAQAQERLTNATSFSGHAAVYLLQATLAWRLDATLSPTVRQQQAAAAVSHVRAERAERQVQDTIFQSWHQVRSATEKSRAARAQITASALAAELARDRYSVGAATQLEVLQAQQDAFRAEVSRIQADTDLAYARAALRASAGRFGETTGKGINP